MSDDYLVECAAHCGRVGLHNLLLAPPQAEGPQDCAMLLTRPCQPPLQRDDQGPDRRLHAQVRWRYWGLSN